MLTSVQQCAVSFCIVALLDGWSTVCDAGPTLDRHQFVQIDTDINKVLVKPEQVPVRVLEERREIS